MGGLAALFRVLLARVLPIYEVGFQTVRRLV